ncbi:carbohydrate kinase family protein [Candidatus Roizmanbacteria bacterium]|nr:carbohydrate kinase family protein [Candidatus Roizmanbacteria bacterium]
MIYVTGSLAFDFIMDFPGRFADQIVPEKVHVMSISFLVETLRESFGGTAGNIAYNLALLGQPVSVVATGGKDFRPYERNLKKHGVTTGSIQITTQDFTARAFITTDLSDNQIAGFYPGAMRLDKTLHIPRVVSENDFVVIAPTDPAAMDQFINECIERNIPFMFDPGMQLPRLSIDTLQKGVEHAKIVIGNDYEIALINLKLKTKKEKRQVKNKNSTIIITTLGEKGSIVEQDNERFVIRAAKAVKIVDPTGAGDAYRAGFLAGFIRGLPLKTCGQIGSVAAVYAVENYGTIEHSYRLEQFKKRYQEEFGLMIE